MYPFFLSWLVWHVPIVSKIIALNALVGWSFVAFRGCNCHVYGCMSHNNVIYTCFLKFLRTLLVFLVVLTATLRIMSSNIEKIPILHSEVISAIKNLRLHLVSAPAFLPRRCSSVPTQSFTVWFIQSFSSTFDFPDT